MSYTTIDLEAANHSEASKTEKLEEICRRIGENVYALILFMYQDEEYRL
jgi:hypothetical protein